MFLNMVSSSENVDVRLTVTQSFRTLASSTDVKDIIPALQRLHSFVNGHGPGTTITSAQRSEFNRAHYTQTLQFLVSNIQADWLNKLSAGQRTELWDGMFLKGPPEQSLLVLMEAIGELRYVELINEFKTCFIILYLTLIFITQSRPSGSLDLIVNITERFLQSRRLADLLCSYCLQTSLSDSPQLRETLLSRISALPDLTANKLHPNNRPLFSPQQYYPLLAKEMLTALERTCQALRGYRSLFCQTWFLFWPLLS